MTSAHTPAAQSARGTSSPLEAALAGKRVLVVDDDDRIRIGMQAFLRGHGLHVDIAGSASEARAITRKRGYVLEALLTDYRLKSGNGNCANGVELAVRLRALFGEGLPVLIVTADHAVGQLPQVRQYGFTVLYKPVKADKMLRALRESMAASMWKPGG